MDNKKYDAVIAGYTCVDMLPGFKTNNNYKSINDLFIPGKLIEVEGMDFLLGGVVPNTGLIMKKFNQKVFLNGLIGTDTIGQMACNKLKEYGVSEGMVKTKSSSTAFSIVIAPPGIDRIFLESPGCNQIFGLEHINFNAISKSRLFHFGYPPLLRQFYLNDGILLSEMFFKIQKMGVITSLDFSLPDIESESGKIDWSVIMEKTFQFLDIYTPSLEELVQTMLPEKYVKLISDSGESEIVDEISLETVEKLGQRIIQLGVKILLIKMGHRGAYLITGDVSSINKKAGAALDEKIWNNRKIYCNAYQVDKLKFKNATGAGDTAVAAFLTAILNNSAPETTVKYAAMAGRESLYCKSIYEDIDSWEELSKKIESEHNELILGK